MNQTSTPVIYSQSSLSRRIARSLGLIGLVSTTALLSACYVVPINHANHANAPYTGGTSGAVAVIPAAPPFTVLNARLYPANDTAARYGVLSGTVSSQLNGRGDISLTQGAELFRGEATRDANNSRNGVANGAGNQGGYMSCTYTMTQTTQGTGTCKFNNGAMYRFHIGG